MPWTEFFHRSSLNLKLSSTQWPWVLNLRKALISLGQGGRTDTGVCGVCPQLSIKGQFLQHAFFSNQSQGHCWAEVTLIIFPLVGFHEKDVKMACLWKSAGRGCELIMSNLVKASLVWEIVINKAWWHLCLLQEARHPPGSPAETRSQV